MPTHTPHTTLIICVGYLAAVIAKLVGPNGRVVGVDHIPELVDQSITNVRQSDPALLDQNQVKLLAADGRLGYPKEAPFDCIHVGAAYRREPKEVLFAGGRGMLCARDKLILTLLLLGQLIAQLKSPGRMFIPLEHSHGDQAIYVFDKDVNGHVSKKELMGVRYVPLTSPEEQLLGR